MEGMGEDLEHEGGDPACWAHLFEEQEGEDPDTGGGTTDSGVDLPSP